MVSFFLVQVFALRLQVVVVADWNTTTTSVRKFLADIVGDFHFHFQLG